MIITSTDRPHPDTPARNKLIAYLREQSPTSPTYISTSSRGPGASDEEVAAEILRVLTASAEK